MPPDIVILEAYAMHVNTDVANATNICECLFGVRQRGQTPVTSLTNIPQGITITVGVIPMRVTEKGQVTIPLQIREALGIKQATEVDFILEGDHAILRRSANTELVAERLARYKGVATTNMSTEQILALTRL